MTKAQSLLKLNKGFTLVELLVVLLIFSVLGVVTTMTVSLSLRGSRKSQATIVARENVSYAMQVITRNLRNAKSIDSWTAPPNAAVDYTDEWGNAASFDCIETNGYIASGSARLTSQNIAIDCANTTFSCDNTQLPHSCDIVITAYDAASTGAEGAMVTSQAKILLRNYPGF